MRELKATDKITQKMTRDGAVSENLATGEVEHISSREPETELSASSEESAGAAADLALRAAEHHEKKTARKAEKADAQAVRDGSAASEKEILNRIRGRLTEQQEQEYRQIIENYRLLEADQTQPNRETRLLELDNQFHRKAFEITGMEAHFDHMLGELQHVERIRKFSLQTNENKSVCAAHTRILEMVLHGTADELGEALESHLNRYKLSVEQARSVHPEYFTEG